MAKRIYSDEERRQRQRERQHDYYMRRKHYPEYIEREKRRRYQEQTIEHPIITLTMDELKLWIKFRKKFGDPQKYDWKGDL